MTPPEGDVINEFSSVYYYIGGGEYRVQIIS